MKKGISNCIVCHKTPINPSANSVRNFFLKLQIRFTLNFNRYLWHHSLCSILGLIVIRICRTPCHTIKQDFVPLVPLTSHRNIPGYTCANDNWGFIVLNFNLWLVGWLVGLRIYVTLAIFQPYRDLEAGNNQSLEPQ